MTNNKKKCTPNWISPPGDTISDILEERDWTQEDFAKRMGISTKHISQLINGKAPITQKTAMKLERVIGGTAGFWLNREIQYRENLHRLEEAKNLDGWVDWLDELPVKELMKSGDIEKIRLIPKNKPEVVNNMLCFFGVASPEEWRTQYKGMAVAFRSAKREHDIGAVSAWLRLGEIEAENADIPEYNASKFKKALNEIRKLTIKSPNEFRDEMQRLCREAGVSLIFVPAISRAHVSGAARWLNPHKPIIQLSLYGKTNDKFWFSFFHEAVHILKHGKDAVFLDDSLDTNNNHSAEEIEANKLASNILIPPKYSKHLSELNSKSAVKQFSDMIGIHPGIVVGRLQYEGFIEQSWMNDLKVHVDSSTIPYNLSKRTT